MKKVKLNGRLSLNKETIAKLNNEQMNAIIGGDVFTTACASNNPPTAISCSCVVSACCTSATTCC